MVKKKRVTWNYFENRPRVYRAPLSFKSNRDRLVIEIPGRLFHAINRARGEFPRRSGFVMNMADAVSYVLQSCPVAVEQEALVW